MDVFIGYATSVEPNDVTNKHDMYSLYGRSVPLDPTGHNADHVNIIIFKEVLQKDAQATYDVCHQTGTITKIGVGAIAHRDIMPGSEHSASGKKVAYLPTTRFEETLNVMLMKANFQRLSVPQTIIEPTLAQLDNYIQVAAQLSLQPGGVEKALLHMGYAKTLAMSALRLSSALARRDAEKLEKAVAHILFLEGRFERPGFRQARFTRKAEA